MANSQRHGETVNVRLVGRAAEYLWFLAALALSAAFMVRAMVPAFRPGDVASDDARQHLFWMARFRDPELFPNDLIADYYQAVAPPGYAALYWALSWFIDPMLASKLLPPLLGFAVALFTFLLARRLHPAPMAAFVATVLLNRYVWQHGDLTSATPREFLLPLLAAQLWSLTTGRVALACGLVVVAALFYPTAGALGLALLGLRLVRLRGWRPVVEMQARAWLGFLGTAAAVVLVLFQGQAASAPFGPLVGVAQAQQMADFGQGGRNAFFDQNPGRYWIRGDRSGLAFWASDPLLKVPTLVEYAALAALLPLLARFGRRLPSVRQLSGQWILLLDVLVVSLGLFFLAHALLFRLYYPSRYVKWSLPLVLAVAAGLGIGILIDSLVAPGGRRWRGVLYGGLALAIGIALLMYPARYENDFRPDRHPAVTAYLRDQPKDLLVAGVPSETDSVPSFARRPVLTSREHMNAFHLGYYRELRQRTDDLIEAYYSESPRELADFAERYGVGVFLVNRAAFNRATFLEAWHGSPNGQWEPFTSVVSRKLERSRDFALLQLARTCAAVDDGTVAAVPTSCLSDS